MYQQPLKQRQQEEYEENGYLIVEGLFKDQVKEIRDQLAAIAANPEEYPGVQIKKQVDDDTEKSLEPLQAVRKFSDLQTVPGYLEGFDADSKVAQISGQMMGTEELRVRMQFSFVKPAQHGSGVPWHQDQMLWPNWNPNAVTCWVALDDCTRENGCLQFARGSHADGMVPHINPEEDDPEPHRYIPGDVVDQYEIDYAIMEPGDAVFFGPKLYHCSDSNQSPNRRLSTGIVYSPAEEWKRSYENGIWVNDMIEADRPIGLSEEIYRDCPSINL